ncbi:hypothetical protein JCM33374_g4620 [Metschnikowia sp. JCM 33374]|nr:hypothetical protein JCM33374_g4620 [Metschnikowia sp. JCM 33374]
MSDVQSTSLISKLKSIVAGLDSRTPTAVKTENGITSGNFFFSEAFHGKFAFSLNSPKVEELEDDKLIESNEAENLQVNRRT